MRSMTYLPRRAIVPHPPNKFRHHIKIGIMQSMHSPHAPASPTSSLQTPHPFPEVTF